MTVAFNKCIVILLNSMVGKTYNFMHYIYFINISVIILVFSVNVEFVVVVVSVLYFAVIRLS